MRSRASTALRNSAGLLGALSNIRIQASAGAVRAAVPTVSGRPPRLIRAVRRQREGKRRLPGQKESVAAGRVKLCWDA